MSNHAFTTFNRSNFDDSCPPSPQRQRFVGREFVDAVLPHTVMGYFCANVRLPSDSPLPRGLRQPD